MTGTAMTEGLIERLGVVDGAVGTPGGGRGRGGRLELRRAWPRNSGLALEYVAPDGGTVAAQWRPSREELRRVTRSTAVHAGDPPPALVATSGGEEVLVQPGGADRRLTVLAPLVRRPGARLLVHRPEQRAVVELPGREGRAYAKVLPAARAGEARRALAQARRLAAGRFAVPETTVDSSPPAVLVTASLSGESLHSLLGEGRAGEAARATGAALRDLHDSSPEGLRQHSEADERTLISRWMERLARYDAPLAEEVSARREAVSRALERGPTTAVVPLHRDLHDRQVLVDAAGYVGLLDLDTLARGEAALDLANLLVHVELRALQGVCERRVAAEAAGAIVEAYDPGAEVAGRLGPYADATRLRLVAVYAFRPRFRALAPAVLSTVGGPLLGGLPRTDRPPRGGEAQSRLRPR